MTSLKKFGLVALVGYLALVIPAGFAQASNSKNCSLSADDPALRCQLQYIQPAPPQTLSGEAPLDPKARLKRYCADLKKAGKEDADSLCRQLQPGL